MSGDKDNWVTPTIIVVCVVSFVALALFIVVQKGFVSFVTKGKEEKGEEDSKTKELFSSGNSCIFQPEYDDNFTLRNQLQLKSCIEGVKTKHRSIIEETTRTLTPTANNDMSKKDSLRIRSNQLGAFTRISDYVRESNVTNSITFDNGGLVFVQNSSRGCSTNNQRSTHVSCREKNSIHVSDENVKGTNDIVHKQTRANGDEQDHPMDYDCVKAYQEISRDIMIKNRVSPQLQSTTNDIESIPTPNLIKCDVIDVSAKIHFGTSECNELQLVSINESCNNDLPPESLSLEAGYHVTKVENGMALFVCLDNESPLLCFKRTVFLVSV